MKAYKYKKGLGNTITCPKNRGYITDVTCSKCEHLRIIESDYVKCTYNLDNCITFTGKDNSLESISVVK